MADPNADETLESLLEDGRPLQARALHRPTPRQRPGRQPRVRFNPAQAAQSLEHVRGAARQAEVELGLLLELLSEDSPRRPGGGLRLIDELVRQAGASGLPITCRFSGAHDALPLDLSDTAYRVAQEGLTNALKHAPGAPVQITVEAGERSAAVRERVCWSDHARIRRCCVDHAGLSRSLAILRLPNPRFA